MFRTLSLGLAGVRRRVAGSLSMENRLPLAVQNASYQVGDASIGLSNSQRTLAGEYLRGFYKRTYRKKAAHEDTFTGKVGHFIPKEEFTDELFKDKSKFLSAYARIQNVNIESVLEIFRGDQPKYFTVVHEAGRVVSACRHDMHPNPIGLSMIPCRSSLLRIHYSVQSHSSRGFYKARLTTLLAGRAAEMAVFGVDGFAAGPSISDLSQATLIARKIATEKITILKRLPPFNTEDWSKSETFLEQVENEMFLLLHEADSSAQILFTKNMNELLTVAIALILEGKLNSEAINMIISQVTIKKQLLSPDEIQIIQCQSQGSTPKVDKRDG